MHIRWRGLELPGAVVADQGTLTGTYGKFTAEPFERGFGTTVGNSLRRVLLSSLEGSAVTQLKLAGALHEFTTIKGVQDTVKDPERAIDSVMKRNETADRAIELARLKMALRDNIATPWAMANGFGGVDPARLAASIDQIAVTYDFTARPKPEAVFTTEFLPPAADRMLAK